MRKAALFISLLACIWLLSACVPDTVPVGTDTAESDSPSLSATLAPAAVQSAKPTVNPLIAELAAGGVQTEKDIADIRDTAKRCITALCTASEKSTGLEYMIWCDGIPDTPSTIVTWAKKYKLTTTFKSLMDEGKMSVEALNGDPANIGIIYANTAYYTAGTETYKVRVRLTFKKIGDEWLVVGVRTLDKAGVK